MGDGLTALQATDGAMDEVHALRDTHGADLVALLGVYSDACGLAFLMANVSPGFASTGFSVTAWSCAVGNLSFPHELGHNMGLHHDQANAGGGRGALQLLLRLSRPRLLPHCHGVSLREPGSRVPACGPFLDPQWHLQRPRHGHGVHQQRLDARPDGRHRRELPSGRDAAASAALQLHGQSIVTPRACRRRRSERGGDHERLVLVDRHVGRGVDHRWSRSVPARACSPSPLLQTPEGCGPPRLPWEVERSRSSSRPRRPAPISYHLAEGATDFFTTDVASSRIRTRPPSPSL